MDDRLNDILISFADFVVLYMFFSVFFFSFQIECNSIDIEGICYGRLKVPVCRNVFDSNICIWPIKLLFQYIRRHGKWSDIVHGNRNLIRIRIRTEWRWHSIM